MLINHELIENIIKKSKYKDLDPKFIEEFAKFLSDEFIKINNINISLQDYKSKLIKINNLHKEEINKSTIDKVAIQSKCEHLLTKYYSDPSGGSDSYEECQICGLELFKTEYRRS